MAPSPTPASAGLRPARLSVWARIRRRQAPAVALATPEILELVFLALDRQALRVSIPRVCTQWRDVAATSPAVQRLLANWTAEEASRSRWCCGFSPYHDTGVYHCIGLPDDDDDL